MQKRKNEIQNEIQDTKRNKKKMPFKNYNNFDTLNTQDTTVTNPRVTLKSLITAKEAGIVIGKQGRSITEIRDISHAKCLMSKHATGLMDRVLTISGSLDSVAKAFALVARKLVDDHGGIHDIQLRTTTITLLIGDMRMGSIIGKGGAKIKEIQEASGATLHASSSLLAHSTERFVTISDIAVYHIGKILGPDLLSNSSNNIPYEPRSDSTPLNPITLIKSVAPTITTHSFPIIHPPLKDSHLETQAITIPNDLAGLVIGKSGVQIKEIRKQSGSLINISPSDPQSSERIITVKGSHASNSQALKPHSAIK